MKGGQSSTLNGKAGRDAQGNQEDELDQAQGVAGYELRAADCGLQAAAGKRDRGRMLVAATLQWAMGPADSGRWTGLGLGTCGRSTVGSTWRLGSWAMGRAMGGGQRQWQWPWQWQWEVVSACERWSARRGGVSAQRSRAPMSKAP